jgi:hypothetical protein
MRPARNQLLVELQQRFIIALLLPSLHLSLRSTHWMLGHSCKGTSTFAAELTEATGGVSHNC